MMDIQYPADGAMYEKHGMPPEAPETGPSVFESVERDLAPSGSDPLAISAILALLGTDGVARHCAALPEGDSLRFKGEILRQAGYASAIPEFDLRGRETSVAMDCIIEMLTDIAAKEAELRDHDRAPL